MENTDFLSCDAQSYINKYRQILNEMIYGMTSADLSDSISHNFIVQMIPHHKAAIEMSKNILNYTENSELAAIAENIISEQTKSIADMRTILALCSRHINTGSQADLYQRRTDRIMKLMFSDMMRAYSDNRISCDFMREMIPHHMGAIRMSNNALQYDICSGLKPILEAIISSQEEGVRRMNSLMKKIGCL